MKKALVLGAGGFIGNHMVDRLKEEGFWVRGVDLKQTEFNSSKADEFVMGDLRNYEFCKKILDQDFEEIYQFAADMGGAGFVFTGENDADIMHNSAAINLNILDICSKNGSRKIFYSSSACMYPEYNQLDKDNPNCKEDSAYPAAPDSEYGWEKLFSERLYFAYQRNYGLNVKVARYHNIFGPFGTWEGGREKAPAAICRKIASSNSGDTIEVWGDGSQTRSFLYIDECIEASLRLMRSDFSGPVNIGSDEMISINDLVKKVCKISNKNIQVKHIDGPLGVKGRNSDNDLIFRELGWKPSQPLSEGLEKTYFWIEKQIKR